MEYREIITSYKENSLDTSKFKEKLEMAKPLKGRSKDRTPEIIGERQFFSFDMYNMVAMPETANKFKSFESDCNYQLNYYYSILLKSIQSTKSWKYMGINPEIPNEEYFKKLTINQKFEVILNLNRKYSEYLEFQKVADIRDSLGEENLSEETIKKVQFFKLMYDGIESDVAKDELYALKRYPKIISALLEYKISRKKKNINLEDFIKTKNKGIIREFEEVRRYFEIDELKDISECLELIQETLEMNLKDIMELLSEIADGELESSYLTSEYTDLKKLQEKYERMVNLKKQADELEGKKAENSEKQNGEQPNSAKGTLAEGAKKQEKINVMDSDATGELDEKITQINNTPSVKEKIIPIIFSWFERDEISKSKNIKLISSFLDRIKELEEQSNTRASMYLVTNANKEVTLSRFNELKKLAEEKGLPRIMEGAFGGYSSFRIDESGQIIDLSTMSDENKEKIKMVLRKEGMTSDTIDTDYLRYKFSDKKDKHITKEYLNYLSNCLKKSKLMNGQPVEFISFFEGNTSGIDVVLSSQLEGLYKLPNYYKAKYHIDPNNILKVQVNQIEEYLRNGQSEER